MLYRPGKNVSAFCEPPRIIATEGNATMSRKEIKTKLNPSLGLTFLISGVTGVLLLFHIKSGGIKFLHEWISVAFLVLCVLHLIINWKIFAAFMKRGPVIASLVGVCLLSGLLLLGGQGQGNRVPGAGQAPGYGYSNQAGYHGGR